MLVKLDKENGRKIIDLPDLFFFKHCQQKFGINRGIYNTIDEYFFIFGVKDIIKRRTTVITFLEYLYLNNGIKDNGRIKFENKGLRDRLNDFINERVLM